VHCKFEEKKKLSDKVFPSKFREEKVFIPSDAENPRLKLSPRNSLRHTDSSGGGGTVVKKNYFIFYKTLLN